jgi:ADP-ribose pyrophosphatase YjhB (NUDIX family)
MHFFRYCPCCASPLGEIHLTTEDRPRLVCTGEGCGYIHYINPKIVSGTLPVHEGKVWLLRRGIEPRMGYWTYPAGFQEWDETTEEAALRETREEIGCDVELDGLMGVYSRAGGPVVNIVYLARFSSRSAFPCTTKEALEVRAFAPDEIPWEDLAFPSTALVISDWVRRVTSPDR